MISLSAAKRPAMALVMLALSGCYYTGPYGYAPYYAPAPALLSQRELPVAPASGASAAAPAPTPAPARAPARAQAQVPAPALAPAEPPPDYTYAPPPVYVAPAYVPYPVYYPAYYPAYYPGWYGPPISIGFGFRGYWGGGHHGGHRH
ncbi:hypothetical protein KDX05_02810 [Burkholderia vietnamiensis]|uniref:hypothetical protein n=1 Tax=Burkholderia vietnamiensis TaxID=60552 RepID=UPI001B8E97BB|nr:hypothetical protein [Burkholderia vietnamiensis]MBR8227246.1 hypothetical protein [Burkholderia vietnamiensis]